METEFAPEKKLGEAFRSCPFKVGSVWWREGIGEKLELQGQEVG